MMPQKGRRQSLAAAVNVRVALRIRPLNERELELEASSVVAAEANCMLLTHPVTEVSLTAAQS